MSSSNIDCSIPIYSEYCVFNQKINNFKDINEYGDDIHNVNTWLNNSIFYKYFLEILEMIYNDKSLLNLNFIVDDYEFIYLAGGGGNQIFNIKKNNKETNYILKIGLDKYNNKYNIDDCFNKECNKDFMNILINRYLSLIHNFCGKNEIGFGFIYEENGKMITINNDVSCSLFLSKKLNIGTSSNDILTNQYYYEMDKLQYICDIIPTYEIQIQ
jgi:hypothetical protein